MKIWRHSLAYYLPNASTLKLLLTYKTVYCDTLWHNSTNVRPFPDGKVLTCRRPYGNTVQYYWGEILQWQVIYTLCQFYCYYLSKRLLRRKLIHISIFIIPYYWCQTQTCIQQKKKKYRGKVGEWPNKNHTSHLRLMNLIYQLTGTRFKPTIPISTEARIL